MSDPTDVAANLGHTVVDDPPWGITAVERWTCTTCGLAVLRLHRRIYGSATETSCTTPAGRVPSPHDPTTRKVTGL